MSELSPLFLPNPDGPALPALFRQAVLTGFNADDGTNTVRIGGSTVTNMPLAVTGAEIGLEAGDNIIVMYLGTSAMIWCKVATPGSANYGASNNGRAGFVDNASNWATSVAGTTVISDSSITVPGWAHSGQITMLGTASTNNSTAVIDNIGSQARVSCPGQADGFSAVAACAVAVNARGSAYSLYSDVIDVTAGAALTFTYTIFTGAAWAARSDNIATLFVAVQFFRESAT